VFFSFFFVKKNVINPLLLVPESITGKKAKEEKGGQDMVDLHYQVENRERVKRGKKGTSDLYRYHHRREGKTKEAKEEWRGGEKERDVR